MLERWKIVVKYNNKEKEIEISKDDFYEIKVGDKVLCDVYCQGKKIVAIELNEHWKEIPYCCFKFLICEKQHPNILSYLK